jgi:hypothetical protein
MKIPETTGRNYSFLEYSIKPDWPDLSGQRSYKKTCSVVIDFVKVCGIIIALLPAYNSNPKSTERFYTFALID